MVIVWPFIFFLYGTIFGSFFNVVGLRVPLRQSIISPRSNCTICKRTLKLNELIPVLSYAWLRGKCHGCGASISIVYPTVEVIVGILFLVAYVTIGCTQELLVGLVFISLLIIVTISDIAYMLIPNKILLPFGVALFGLRIVSPLTPWWDSLLGAAIGFGLLYIVSIVSKGGIGGGDIKLFFIIGLVLGVELTLLSLFLSSFLGAIFGFSYLQKSGKHRRTPIPFGPSIMTASLISYFYGEFIVEWYLSLFH